MSHVGRNWQREREPWGRGVTGLIADRHTSLAGENAENLLFVPYNTILFDFDYWFWLEHTLSEMNMVKDTDYIKVAVWPEIITAVYWKRSSFCAGILLMTTFSFGFDQISSSYFAEHSVLVESRLLISATYLASAKSKLYTFGWPLAQSLRPSISHSYTLTTASSLRNTLSS